MVHAQKDKWILYPKEVDFDTGPSFNSIGFSSPDAALTTPYMQENAVYDETGDLLFYYQNGNIFEADGQLAGSNDYISAARVNGEVVILPVPGTCRSYCIFTLHTLPLSTFFLVAQEVTVGSGGSLTVTTAQVIEGNDFPNTLPGNTGSIGASKILNETEANRYIYVAVNTLGQVRRYTMTSSGTSNPGTSVATFRTSSDAGSELEISPNGQFIAWSVGDVAYLGSISGSTVIHYTTLDGEIKGLEFSANSGVLLASVDGVGIVKINTATPFAESTISSSSDYDNTYLELGKDGKIYCVNNSDGKLAAIQSNLTTITATSNVIYSNAESVYALPDQIDGEGDDLFYGVAPITLDNLSIDDLDLPVAVGGIIPAFYNCDNIDLVVEYTGTPTDYGIEIYSVNPSTGTKITGVGYLDYSDDFSGAPEDPIDLRCIEDAVNCDLFDGYFGQTFAVRVVIKTECEELDRIGYFKVYDAPTAASIKLDVYAGNGPICPSSQTPAAPCDAGLYSGSIGLANSSGDITYYQISIDETNCSTGAVIQNLYNGSVTAVSSVPALVFGLNSFVIGGSTGYFANPANNFLNKCIKVTAEVGNNCGSDSQYSYILFDGAYFGGGSEEGKLLISKPVGEIQYEGAPVSVFPNPAMDILNIRLAGKGEEHVLISIVDATGRVLKQVRVDTENSDFPVSVSDLPSGAYHYRISTSQQITAGTFLKY